MRFILTLAFLCCSSQDAGALVKAAAQDYREIGAKIRKMKAVESAIDKKNQALIKARDNEALARDITAQITRLEKQRKDVAEQAIWLTVRAYGIVDFHGNEPALPFGTSVLLSPEKGFAITWLPIFDELGVKSAQNQFGKPAGSMNFLPRNAGNTASDGISRIFPGAFDSPVELASYIIHELRHFKQNTTAGEGDKKTTAELEVEAYEEEQALMNDPGNILGYSNDIRKRQEDRLTGLLEGEDGNPGFKALAKEQRSAADKLRGGRPLPERSLVSHSDYEISSLVKQARKQIEIAQRDHDERLRRLLRELTRRSCQNPGSVTQSELDGIPKPHLKDFIEHGEFPAESGGCASKVYFAIARDEVNAKELRRMSEMNEPVNPNQPREPATVRPNPVPQFSAVFPRLSELAVAACLSPGQAAIDTFLYSNYDFSHTGYDRDAATNIESRLEGCPQQLFRALLNTIKAGEGWKIDRQWILNTVAAFSSGPGTTPGDSNPPVGVTPPYSDPCRDNGNKRCPK